MVPKRVGLQYKVDVIKRKRNIKGEVAFVTWAGTGIGRTTARAFAQEGASVVLSVPRLENIYEAAKPIEDQGLFAVSTRGISDFV